MPTDHTKRTTNGEVYVATYIPNSLNIQLFEVQARLQRERGKRVFMTEIIQLALEKLCQAEKI